MPKQNDTPNLSDMESSNTVLDAPTMPPPGTPAQFKTEMRWNANIDAANVPAQARESYNDYGDDELDISFLDPLTVFCERWGEYAGRQLTVVRHPDPPIKRRPGAEYNRPCFDLTNLGTMTFDPGNLVYDLQLINDNSGGAFRLFLRDYDGTMIAGARLDYVVIADPPRDMRQQQNKAQSAPPAQPYQPPAPPPKSEAELQLERTKDALFTRALERALNPPPPPDPPNPMSLLSTEDQLAIGVMKNSNVLQTVIEKISSVAQQPNNLDAVPTWKDKVADAVVQSVANNPQIIAQTADIAARTINALSGAILTVFAPRNPQFVNAPIPGAPVPVPHPARQPQPRPQAPPAIPQRALDGLPETPQPVDTGLDSEEEDIELLMIDELVKLMLSVEPLRLDHPVLLDLQKEYPDYYAKALTAIKMYPEAALVHFLSQISDFAANMFASEVTGPHLRKRLTELKALIKAPAETEQQLQQQQTNAAPDNAQA